MADLILEIVEGKDAGRSSTWTARSTSGATRACRSR